MDFQEFVDIVAKLRAPDGCPWDREQTRETLIPYLIEEFYELIDAFDENKNESIKEELGDVLFQIVLQSQLSQEKGDFDIDDVIKGIGQKMISRHPHVFGGKALDTSEEVKALWEQQKQNEGKLHESVMDRVPNSLPALVRAQKLQLKATKVGFDWERIEDVYAKLDEEMSEFREALRQKKHADIEEELGDILFVLVRVANFVNVNPEDALRKTINKFLQRFRHIESEASLQGRTISDMTLEEMEEHWNRAKKEKKE